MTTMRCPECKKESYFYGAKKYCSDECRDKVKKRKDRERMKRNREQKKILKAIQQENDLNVLQSFRKYIEDAQAQEPYWGQGKWGQMTWGSDKEDSKPVTESQVRRIFREELIEIVNATRGQDSAKTKKEKR